jgi:hypothetical protein
MRTKKLKLKGGLDVTVSLLEHADAEFVGRYKRRVLALLKDVLSPMPIAKHGTTYVVTFHWRKPAHAVCIGQNYRPMMDRLKSQWPWLALEWCSATVFNGRIQTHVFAKFDPIPLLQTALMHGVQPEAAALLYSETENREGDA